MITRERYTALANRLIQGEFLHILQVAIDAFDAVNGNDFDRFAKAMEGSGVGTTKLASMLHELSQPTTTAEDIDLRPMLDKHNLLPDIHEVRLTLVRTIARGWCDKPEHDHKDDELEPTFLFIEGKGGNESTLDLPPDEMTRFNLIVSDAMIEAGCTPEQVADMMPDVVGGPQAAVDVERNMSAKLKAEIDQEVAEFRTTIDADLDKMFGGGDSS